MAKRIITQKSKSEIKVFESKGELWISSIDIANDFDKRHADVLRAIENLECSLQFRQRNFALTNYTKKGITYPCCNMTKNGMAWLVLGFIGKDAAEWKEKYINAFDAMLKRLQKSRYATDVAATFNQSDPLWQPQRNAGIIERRGFTDAVQKFTAYAKAQGSANEQRYYSNMSNLVNRLFVFNESVKNDKNKRKSMTTRQLGELANIEHHLADVIYSGMESDLPYKEIYLACKGKIDKYIDLFGTTPVTNIVQIKNYQQSLLG